MVASDALDSRGVFFVPGFHGLQVLHFMLLEVKVKVAVKVNIKVKVKIQVKVKVKPLMLWIQEKSSLSPDSMVFRFCISCCLK